MDQPYTIEKKDNGMWCSVRNDGKILIRALLKLYIFDVSRTPDTTTTFFVLDYE